jgi:hypothetical protein
VAPRAGLTRGRAGSGLGLTKVRPVWGRSAGRAGSARCGGNAWEALGSVEAGRGRVVPWGVRGDLAAPRPPCPCGPGRVAGPRRGRWQRRSQAKQWIHACMPVPGALPLDALLAARCMRCGARLGLLDSPSPVWKPAASAQQWQAGSQSLPWASLLWPPGDRRGHRISPPSRSGSVHRMPHPPGDERGAVPPGEP